MSPFQSHTRSGSAHLFLANLSEEGEAFKIFCKKCDGFENYILERTEKEVGEIFAKEDIVYLSPDAKEPLEDIHSSKVYVIGGLVDETVKKNETMELAKEKGFQCRRLPIEEHCTKAEKGTFKRILAVNQVRGFSVQSSKLG